MEYAVTDGKKSKKAAFLEAVEKSADTKGYNTAKITLEDKRKILDTLGQPQLIEVFKEWKPRTVRKRPTAPLDQRVSITITKEEKLLLDKEIATVKSSGDKITGSQLIRNRALGSVDINGWREIALAALKELSEIEEEEADLRKSKQSFLKLIDETDDDEDLIMYERDLAEINDKLGKLVAKPAKRNVRLSGRMSVVESETMKWRSQKLCISGSDYMRMMLFGFEPNSIGDSHMSIDSRRRFYISILDVADNGFGEPPNVYQCSQCALYVEEIEKLKDRIAQLETFV